MRFGVGKDLAVPGDEFAGCIDCFRHELHAESKPNINPTMRSFCLPLVMIFAGSMAVSLRRRRVRRNLGSTDLLSRHAVIFTGPFIEVDQLATFGTERAPLVILPFDWPATRGTLTHTAKVRRMERKVKQSVTSAANESVLSAAADGLRLVSLVFREPLSHSLTQMVLTPDRGLGGVGLTIITELRFTTWRRICCAIWRIA